MVLSLYILLSIYAFIYLYWLTSPFQIIQNLNPEIKKISIVIAFRNEEKNILHLIKTLNNLNFPKDSFEVLLIDDHSTDNSLNLVNSTIHKTENIKVYQNINSGKKAALTLGIQKAKYEYIFCTDADVHLSDNILQNYSAIYSDANIGAILGPVQMNGDKSFLSQFQIIDFTMMQLATIFSINRKKIFLANGANISYKKNIFEEVQGFNQIDSTPSGDDILLLYKFQNKTKIVFSDSKETIVNIEAEKTTKSFINQRLRWASKTNNYPWGFGSFVTWIFALFNLNLFICMFLCALNLFNLKLFLSVILIKYILEALLYVKGRKLYKTTIIQFVYLLLFQPFHIMYIVFIGLFSQFSSYNWKGRKQ